MNIELKEPQQIIDAVAAHEAKIAGIEKERGEWKQWRDDLVADGGDVGKLNVAVERALRRLDAAEAQLSRSPGGSGRDGQEAKSLGEVVVAAEAVAEIKKKLSFDGSFVRGMRASIALNGIFLNPGIKTTITSATIGSSTPGILVPERVPGIVKAGVRRVRVRDLLPRFETSNNAVEFVKENVFTNASSPTAETISKPESALTFTIDSEPVRTIAHWIPAAKQVLDDFPALRGFIDQRLIEGLKDTEDAEILYGAGTGSHLNGLSNEATAYDTARNVAADTKIDKANHYISQIEDANLSATGLVMKNSDWRAIQLLKDDVGGANTGAYLLGGPRGDAEPMLWGLPVATSQAVQAGHLFCGAFATHTAIWDRMDAVVEIATEHADYFIRNMIAILAEERLALTCYRADAVVYGAF